MEIKFDDIHTDKKQNLLNEMMEKVNQEILDLSTKLKDKITRCPICKSSEINFFVSKYGFDMDKCNGCGLIFCNPYPTDEQVNYYYNSDMKIFENEFFMESFERRVQLFNPRIELMRSFCTDGKLLDIGSAIGIFIEALNQSTHNFQTTCCDINTEACQKLSSRYPDIVVINSDFRELKKNSKYDLVTMWDTVEHIVDQTGLFHSINKILRKSGFFFFSTPNTKSFEWLVADTEHVQILPPGHVNLMNIDNITILLRKSGFKLKTSVTMNPSLDVDYLLKNALSNDIIRTNLGAFLFSSLRDKLFRSQFETILKDNKMAGNIVVVAQKVTNSI